MKTQKTSKEKARCPYFDSLYGLPTRYGIQCYDAETNEVHCLDFNKDEKIERDIYFESRCCSGGSSSCKNYTVKYLNGWLSPSGEYIKCPYTGHLNSADEIVKKYKIPPSYDKYGYWCNGELLLERLGWIKIYATPYGEGGNIFHMGHIHGDVEYMTNEQFKFLNHNVEKMTDGQKRDFKVLCTYIED